MNQYALVVGVSCFQNGLQSLAYVEDDVNDFCGILSDHFHIDCDDISYFTNATATEDEIMSAVRDICAKVSKGDRVILYFATHGKTSYNTTYLSAYDASVENEGDTKGWIRVEQILGDFHNAGCSIIAFIDSCHSTQFCISRSNSEVAPNNIWEEDSPGEYMAVFAAAGENENAYPDPDFGHGCWTHYLIEALSGRAPRAFSGNTGRITIHSLQPYLKEKVSARMLERYQKVQTPHFWGTYPDDILIVEHSLAEDKWMKVKDIYFGAIDTDSEKDSVPHADFLAKNFYDLDSVSGKLADNNALHFIVGNKGSGKTYLGKYLEDTNKNSVYESVGMITLSDIQKITTAQADIRGKYIPAWKYTLFTILACIIVRKDMPGATEFRQFLSDIYGNQLDIILSEFSASKRMLLNKKIKRGIKMCEAFDAFEDDNGKTYIDGLNVLYSYLFNKYYRDNKVYFLIDGLDEQFRVKINEDQQNSLLDLFAAVNESHVNLVGIKIILLFRNDLLHTLPSESNKNKDITERSHPLTWLSNDTCYRNTPLYQFMEKRITTSAEAAGISTGVSLTDILPPQMRSAGDSLPVETWYWILTLTTYTPRDIVSFFNCCKKYSGEQRFLTQENLWSATRDYSIYLWDEFQDVLVGTPLGNRGTELETLFNRIAQSHNIRTNTRFTFAEFQAHYLQIEELKDIPIAVALKVLYEVGIMCVHTNSGTYWSFRENPLKFDIDIWVEAQYDIHTGLWKKMHIW